MQNFNRKFLFECNLYCWNYFRLTLKRKRVIINENFIGNNYQN